MTYDLRQPHRILGRPARSNVHETTRWAVLGVALGSLLAASGVSTPLAGQVLRGQVLDATTEAAVSGAEVVVRDESGSLLSRIAVDPSGEFTLLGLPAGLLRVEVEAFGYTTEVPEPVTLGTDVLFMDIRMRSKPMEMGQVRVTVEAQKPYLWSNGFYHRMKVGHGRFMRPSRLAVMSVLESSEIFRRMPGVNVYREEPRFHRGPMSFRRCRPTIYQDGVPVRSSQSTASFNDVVVPAHMIDAVEAYPGPAGAPPQWRHDAACGLIVVWTKH